MSFYLQMLCSIWKLCRVIKNPWQFPVKIIISIIFYNIFETRPESTVFSFNNS